MRDSKDNSGGIDKGRGLAKKRGEGNNFEV
jgi:hypothetical protein